MSHPITKVSNFGFDVLNKELDLSEEEKTTIGEILDAYQGDFWQKGKGSLFPPATGGNSSVITNALEKRFIHRNIIKEIVGRVSGAFFSKSPNWSFRSMSGPIEDMPPESGEADPQIENPEPTPLSEFEKALGEFWSKKQVAKHLALGLESRLVSGRGAVRVYIPTKHRKEATGETAKSTDAFVEFKSFEEALDAIEVEYVRPTQARVLTDGGELISIVRYEERSDWTSQSKDKVIEFSFVDDANDTYIGVAIENRTNAGPIAEAVLSDPLKLGGRVTTNEFKGEPYVTKAMYKNNQLVNLSLTCAGFSVVDNGFGEIFLSNVALETEEVPNPDGSGTISVPKKMVRGGGTIQNLVGMSEIDPETGAETRMTPSVTFREPSALQAFKDGKELGYQSCLEEAGQLYALISGDATVSGESRVQAMTDFWMKIRPYKAEVDNMGENVLTVVCLLAAALCKTPPIKMDEGFSVAYDSKVFIGQLSTEESRFAIERWKAGVISMETLQVLLGVEDPVLEAEKIQAEQQGDLFNTNMVTFSTKMDLAQKMNGTFPEEYILKFLGITDPEEINKIREALSKDAEVINQRLTGTGADEGGFN